MGWQSLWQSLVNWNINNNNILKKLISILFWYFLVVSTIISTIIPTIYRDGIKICCLVDIMLPYSWSRLKNNINYNWLVVEPTPQLGLLFPTEWKNKSHVPNHQPDNINYDINFSHGFPKIQWIGCRQKKVDHRPTLAWVNEDHGLIGRPYRYPRSFMESGMGECLDNISMYR